MKKKNVVRPVLMFTLLFSLFVRTGVTWESHNTIMGFPNRISQNSPNSMKGQSWFLAVSSPLSLGVNWTKVGVPMGGNFAHRQKLKMIEESLCE